MKLEFNANNLTLSVEFTPKEEVMLSAFGMANGLVKPSELTEQCALIILECPKICDSSYITDMKAFTMLSKYNFQIHCSAEMMRAIKNKYSEEKDPVIKFGEDVLETMLESIDKRLDRSYGDKRRKALRNLAILRGYSPDIMD